MLLLSAEGQPLVHTAYPMGAPLPDLAEPESFERVVRTHQPLVGDIAVGRGPKRSLAFPVRVPVMRGGELRYVLTAVITPEALVGVVASPASGQEEWIRTLVDPQGQVAARTLDPERFVE